MNTEPSLSVESVESVWEEPSEVETPKKYSNIYKNALYSTLLNEQGEEEAVMVMAECDGEFMDSGLIQHAQEEFKILGWPGECEMQKMACDNIIELLGTFASQGHTGMSAPYIINLFTKLAKWEIIAPLTGEDSEWRDVSRYGGDGTLYQNKRASHVFKTDTEVYDSEGKIFREPDGCCFTSSDSRVPVVFPYTPKREYVDVPSRFETEEVDNSEPDIKS